MKRPEFLVDFSEAAATTPRDGLPDSPSFQRNHRPILNVLIPWLAHRSGDVVEIGSGTGQHLVAFAEALPDLAWWPSDPSAEHVAIIARRRSAGAPANVMPPVLLDAAGDDWQFGTGGRPPAAGLAAMVCINVLHIAPWPVAGGLMRGAARHLAPGSCLFVYGPFKRDGAHTSPGNAAFDESLRARNPDWGVRDVAEVEAEANRAGLQLAETRSMPANNLTLVFQAGA